MLGKRFRLSSCSPPRLWPPIGFEPASVRQLVPLASTWLRRQLGLFIAPLFTPHNTFSQLFRSSEMLHKTQQNCARSFHFSSSLYSVAIISLDPPCLSLASHPTFHCLRIVSQLAAECLRISVSAEGRY